MVFDNGGHLQKTRGGIDAVVIDGPFAKAKAQTIDITDDPFRTLKERVEKL